MGCRREEKEIGPDRQAQKTDPKIESHRRKRIRFRVGHQLRLGGVQRGVSIPASPAKTGSQSRPDKKFGRCGGGTGTGKAEVGDGRQRPVREVLCQVRGVVVVVGADAVRSNRSIKFLHFAQIFEAILKIRKRTTFSHVRASGKNRKPESSGLKDNRNRTFVSFYFKLIRQKIETPLKPSDETGTGKIVGCGMMEHNVSNQPHQAHATACTFLSLFFFLFLCYFFLVSFMLPF